MKTKLKDVPLGCFFTINNMLCYKDNLTNGTDTNFCVVEETFMGRPRFWLNRGYSTESKTLLVKIIDERFLTQLTLF